MSKVLRPPVGAPAPAPDRQTGVVGGLVRTARPKQWAKSVLVFAAPGAAGVLGHAAPLGRTFATFALFCALASGVYMLNDAVDADSDRHHPRKRDRPVAAGVVSRRLAFTAGATLVAAAMAAAGVLEWKLLVVVASYLGVQVAYSLWLKHEPIFDLAAVATGFVLRAIAGGVATHVPISEWFLIVAMFGSLMMVTGKRFAEHQQLGADRGRHRATLDVYSETFLRGLLLVSAAVAITAYCLWAFERQHAAGYHGGAIWYELSIAPFVLALLRYVFMVDTGHGGQPEEVVLSDRALQLTGAVWIALFALGVY
jgi:decaprenyl-phosphate phosphoribosyltransferase